MRALHFCGLGLGLALANTHCSFRPHTGLLLLLPAGALLACPARILPRWRGIVRGRNGNPHTLRNSASILATLRRSKIIRIPKSAGRLCTH
ncbi:uncharacterized protein P884DRAFT_262656 [Thermothelomyces heterothallicus CBS 202.75]|uniref:uncharacterized protein n=1 Tax=Thermothelomyces heterothallicus CBS 202.75 TaxID=1149848 RepID=UPI0037442063